MDYFREQFEYMLNEQKKMLEDYNKEYDLIYGNGDEDHLICCMSHGEEVYFRARREKNGKYTRKSLRKNPDAINGLARKEYLRTAIGTLRHNIDLMERGSRKLEGLDLESLLPRMHKAYRGLPEECFFAKELGHVDKLSGNNETKFRRHRAWANEPYEKSDYRPEGRRFMTSAGFKVRSKSEQHIVEQLVNYGVPFRYEQVIRVNDVSYSADFTFRETNGDLFFWEHAGMMDDLGYVSRHRRKMDVFERIGIVPWKNLIITYDVDGVINVPLIKSIIEHDVIPRL